jgi:hypothetical protein
MTGQKQSDQLGVRVVWLHFLRGMGPPCEGKIRPFPSVLLVLGALREHFCQSAAMPEKAARHEMGEVWLRDSVA